MHAPVHCDDLAEPPGIKDWDFKNVRKVCGRGHTARGKFRDRLCRKFAVVEPFHDSRISRESSAIEEYAFNLVLCDSLEDLYKGSFRLHQRKASRCDYVKEP